MEGIDFLLQGLWGAPQTPRRPPNDADLAAAASQGARTLPPSTHTGPPGDHDPPQPRRDLVEQHMAEGVVGRGCIAQGTGFGGWVVDDVSVGWDAPAKWNDVFTATISTPNGGPDGDGRASTKKQEVMELPNGDLYRGHVLDGRPHGRGTYRWNDGSVYDGEWVQGMKHGRGVYHYACGDTYEGGYHQGTKHGFGVAVWSNGSRYEGNWHAGREHGHGRYVTAQGQCYTGNFSQGKVDGEGVHTWEDGVTFHCVHSNGVAVVPGLFSQVAQVSDGAASAPDLSGSTPGSASPGFAAGDQQSSGFVLPPIPVSFAEAAWKTVGQAGTQGHQGAPSVERNRPAIANLSRSAGVLGNPSPPKSPKMVCSPRWQSSGAMMAPAQHQTLQGPAWPRQTTDAQRSTTPVRFAPSPRLLYCLPPAPAAAPAGVQQSTATPRPLGAGSMQAEARNTMTAGLGAAHAWHAARPASPIMYVFPAGPALAPAARGWAPPRFTSTLAPVQSTSRPATPTSKFMFVEDLHRS